MAPTLAESAGPAAAAPARTTPTAPTAGPARSVGSAAPTTWRRVALVGTGLVLLLSVMVTAFMWPGVRGVPRDVPVGIAAPAAEAQQLAGALEQAQPGAFDVRTYSGADAARQAVADHEVYGAIVLDADGGQMLTAPAASPAIATALGQVADVLAAQAAQAAQAMGVDVPDLMPVVPVVALPADDPRGVGLPAAALPLVLASVATGVVSVFAIRGVWRRVAVATSVAVIGGIAVASLAGPWLGSLTGDFWAQAGVVGLGVGAIALAIVGAHALLGRVGVGLVAATMIVLGNPLSAAATAPELLPAGWGDLGQALPPGAVVAALRSVAYFDGAAVAGPLTVLVAWLAGGALLLGTALVLGRRTHEDLGEGGGEITHP